MENSLEMALQEIQNYKFLDDFKRAGIATCTNPFTSDKFKDKKFYRYINKIDKMLMEKLNAATSNSEKINIYSFGIASCINAMIADMPEKDDFIDKNAPEEYETLGIHQVLMKPNVQDIINNLDNRNLVKIHNYMYNMARDFIVDNSLPNDAIRIAKISFENAIIDYILNKYINEEVNENNYMVHLPNLLDLHFILYDYQSKLYTNLIFWIIHQLLSQYDLVNEEEFKRIQDDIDIVIENNKKIKAQLKEELANKANYYPTLLKYKKEAEEGTKQQQEMFNDAIIAKDREIRRLEKQIESLQDKLTNIKEHTNNTDIIEEIDKILEENKASECDTTLKYTFVTIDTTGMSYILEEFPNSILIDNYNSKLSMDTALVVFMSSKLKHDLYFKIKNVCKANNIPYIHNNYSNIEMLKTEIAKKLND